MTILVSIISFLVAIAILVGIHEFGHFWVARKLGIKIIRFAIGFGTPIWTHKSKDKDATEYVLAAIPLGGYVKMLDEREGDVDESEKHRAFNTQPVWKRFLVVLAGPMFNFFFAMFAFAVIQMMGVNSAHPYIGTIKQNTVAAQSGFEHKDLVTSINGIKTESTHDVRMTLLTEYLKNPDLKINVETQSGALKTRRLDLSKTLLLSDQKDFFAKTGISFWQPPFEKIWVARLIPDSVAEKSGLKDGDILKFIDDKKIETPRLFVEHISSHVNQKVVIQVERDGAPKSITLTPLPKQLSFIQGLKVKWFGENEESLKNKNTGRIGMGLGADFTAKDRKELTFIKKESFFPALNTGVEKTWDMSIMTLKVMGKLLTGEVSIKNISGPITIANYAGKSALIGFSAFLALLAVVSLSLGVLNLLPIPMLDGGHLMYYIIEVIKGSPVSERVEAIGMQVGMSLVGVLMIVAMYNDIGRLF